MSYTSPFGTVGDAEHNGPDALCLSRTYCANAIEDTLAEYHQIAIAAIECGTPQPAFFLARQVAELGLKALLGADALVTHSLTKLLDRLGQRGDDLLAGGDEQDLIVEFVRDLDSRDGVGDQGRYPTTVKGDLSLATVCCVDPALHREHVDRLYGYVRQRLVTLNTGAKPAGAAS
jgi:HEPN domain-containing protein